MKYLQVSFTCKPCSEIVTDVLAGELSEIGFDSFISSEDGLEAYVNEALFSEEKIKDVIRHFCLDVKIDYSVKKLEDKNWNEEWEKNYFKPIEIDNRCIIRGSSHHPDKSYDYQVIINPKKAFGSGHHQTTELILQEILDMDLQNKSVLDMGCGTAVLAILASMRGARSIVAIDIDDWAYNNALENIQLNNVNNVNVKLGGAELLKGETFDVIFANINRNILLQDISTYSKVLNIGGKLILSGFYKEDIPIIRMKCEENELQFSHSSEKDNWVIVVCTR